MGEINLPKSIEKSNNRRLQISRADVLNCRFFYRLGRLTAHVCAAFLFQNILYNIGGFQNVEKSYY